MIQGIKKRLELYSLKKIWRAKNEHNFTTAGNAFDPNKVSVGNYSYGCLNVINTHYSNERLEIGHYCSIAANVQFFLAGCHFTERLMTYPINGILYGMRGKDGYSKGPIIVGSDVWIGYGAMILSGVKIAQGAVIGAGSVVAKDVPPYAIVAGNRAEILRFRFQDELISELLELDFSKLTPGLSAEYIEELTRVCDQESIRSLMAVL